MRLIRTLVLEEDLDSVSRVLDGHDVDYLVFREDSHHDGRVLVEFPLPTQAVESIMEELRSAQRAEESYTVMTTAESVRSENVDEMEERFVTGTEEDDSIATEEIRAKALDLTPSPRTYYAMTLLSALVATAGLLLDSPAVVVGSMVIAPLVGSALTASVGTVLDERTMIAKGFTEQVFGLILAILGALAFSVALRSAAFMPPPLDVTTLRQISQRIAPGLLSVVIGLCAGASGAFGLATGVPVTLVGVMIAAALIPAAAAVGIGIAWGIPAVATGASLLLVLNLVAIHVTASSVLWYLGYRPDWWTGRPDLGTLKHAGSVALTIVVLGSVFVGSGLIVSAHIAFDQSVNGAVGDVLAEERYEDLELVSVRSDFDAGQLLTTPGDQRVTVVVARPADRGYDALGRTVAERIREETGREVTVVIEFVDQQTYPAEQRS